jgi:hypothetical protein
MKILHFEMNVPKELALASPSGTLVEGRYGNRMMFHLSNGQVMYVPPIVATKIEEAGIAPGESFELCKTSVRDGRRRSVEWNVKRTDAPSQLEQNLRASLDAVHGKTATARGPQLVEKEGASDIPPFAPVHNGNGNHGGPPHSENANNHPASATKLEHALKTAISAARNAEIFGSELGYVVRFDSDAIKSMAITVLINMSGEGRR